LINGTPTSLRVVRSVADKLVDVNGQAASLALRDTQQQLLLLDRLAGVTGLRQQLAAAVSQLGEIERRLSQLDALGDDEDREALQRRIDILDRAGLQPGVYCVLQRAGT
jgi:DNA repair ATPase RecN